MTQNVNLHRVMVQDLVTCIDGAVGNMHLLILAISTMGNHPWLPLLQPFACSFYGRALLLVHAFDVDSFCF